MCLQELRWDGVNCNYLSQDREKMVGFCEHGNGLLGSMKGVNFLD
jgi:hypothetical protein